MYARDAKALKRAHGLAQLSVIAAPAIAAEIGSAGLALADDPEEAFYRVHEYLARSSDFYWAEFATQIHPSAQIDPHASVAPKNVRIDAGVVIEPHVTVLERVTIGEGAIIRAGAVLGAEGFEFKARALRQHAGSVVIGRRVEIQSNAVIDRALFRRPTRIGDDTKIDNVVHIAHSAEIGQRCLIVAGAIIAGSVSIGDDVWIGPGAIVSNGVRVGDRATIVLGTTVVRDVESDTRVSADLRIFRV